MFDSFMIGHDYFRSQYDNHVHHKKLSNWLFIYLFLYMDGMLIAHENKYTINDLKSLLKSVFDMKDLGTAKKILEMEIRREKCR